MASILQEMGTRRHRAFTLIELIVALAIVALLAAIAIPVYSAVQQQAQQKTNTAQYNSVAQAVSSFYAVNGCYPDVTAYHPSNDQPSGLGPYVGTWPTNVLYYALNSSQSAWVGSGGTAYYIGVGPDWTSGSPPSTVVWIVYNNAVPIC